MKLNRTLVLCLAIVLSAAMALSSTLAYLQDSDSDVNVMTLGNVYIEQIEQKRDAAGGLVDFTDDQWLYPGVYDIGKAEAEPALDNDDVYYNAGVNNAIDKIISVKNTGKSEAYVRTWIAFESGSLTSTEFEAMIHRNTNETAWTWDAYDENPVTISGSTYVVYCATYTANNGILPAGQTTDPSLKQVLMSKDATNDTVTAIDGNGDGLYNILAYSQAVQTAGFESQGATYALNEAFGDGHPWKEGMPDELPKVYAGDFDSFSLIGDQTAVIRNLNVDAHDGPAITVKDGHVNIIVDGQNKLIGGDDSPAILVEDGATVTISGTGSLTAIGNKGEDNSKADDTVGGHGIGGEGTIIIDGLNSLDAQGWGQHGFGIGGQTKSITIKNTHITNVQGGYVQATFNISEDSYGKKVPEGGAAIGTSVDGSVITLDNVTIDTAKGGGKSAGIGAMYWTGTTINIRNSTIKEVIGGATAAGIGGSRVDEHKTNNEQAVTINIDDSTINATGGTYAAGIGSGYDNNCQNISVMPMHTINITGDSVITAQGGKYGAGIGTGYHVASLAGKIEDSVEVTATGGGNREKYTIAQDVGFGVIDHSREANSDNNCSFDYKGTIITVASPTLVSNQ